MVQHEELWQPRKTEALAVGYKLGAVAKLMAAANHSWAHSSAEMHQDYFVMAADAVIHKPNPPPSL